MDVISTMGLHLRVRKRAKEATEFLRLSKRHRCHFDKQQRYQHLLLVMTTFTLYLCSHTQRVSERYDTPTPVLHLDAMDIRHGSANLRAKTDGSVAVLRMNFSGGRG